MNRAGLITLEQARAAGLSFDEPEPRACPHCGTSLVPLGAALAGKVAWVSAAPLSVRVRGPRAGGRGAKALSSRRQRGGGPPGEGARARSAWGEELENVSRPLQAACRRATMRVQGALGRASDRRGRGKRHEIGHGHRGFRAWDATPRRLPRLSRGFTSERHGEDGGEFPSRGASVRNGTAFPAPLAADMRTGPLAARWFSAWNGYGAAQHVS